jgi:hypothetical protein
MKKLAQQREEIEKALSARSPLERYDDLEPNMRDKLEEELDPPPSRPNTGGNGRICSGSCTGGCATSGCKVWPPARTCSPFPIWRRRRKPWPADFPGGGADEPGGNGPVAAPAPHQRAGGAGLGSGAAQAALMSYSVQSSKFKVQSLRFKARSCWSFPFSGRVGALRRPGRRSAASLPFAQPKGLVQSSRFKVQSLRFKARSCWSFPFSGRVGALRRPGRRSAASLPFAQPKGLVQSSRFKVQSLRFKARSCWSFPFSGRVGALRRPGRRSAASLPFAQPKGLVVQAIFKIQCSKLPLTDGKHRLAGC